ncbi:MAG: hypothetical protein QOE46_2087 [Acidobacteriota bacterium]|jgi:hypothetical protein|nr:hypothetical protein [Acidobacteriota bacterium]
MPVRKIPRSYVTVTGLTASGGKSDDSTGYESSLEHLCHKLLVFNSNVLKYEEQPIRIYFPGADGKTHHYTPDLFLNYRQDIAPAKYWKPLLAEVKWRKDLFKDWQELKPKFRAARRYTRERHWDFAILTNKEIITPYLANAIFLLTFRKHPINKVHSTLLLQAMEELGETDPETLLLTLTDDPNRKAELIPTLWQLVANHLIGVSMDTRLTMRSRIWTIQPQGEVERDEGIYQLIAGRSRRMRWRALRYHEHLNS